MPYFGSTYKPQQTSNEQTPLIRNKKHTPNYKDSPAYTANGHDLTSQNDTGISENNLSRKPRSYTVGNVDTLQSSDPQETGADNFADVRQKEINGYHGNREWASSASSMLLRLRSFRVPRAIVNVGLAAGTVIFMVTYVVMLPIYAGVFSNPDTGSDAYIAILLAAVWFPFIFFAQVFFIKAFIDRQIALKPQAAWSNLFLVGATMALNGIFLGLTSPPERTPPHFQALLQTMLIPFTVLARMVLLRKGITKGQFGCLFCLFVGLFISLEPSIFGLDSTGASSGGGRAYYTAIFALSWLPAAVGYVLIEKGQKPEDDSLVYMSWVQVFLYSTYLLLLWVDFMPIIGMANSPMDFLKKLKRGFVCLYGGDSKCKAVPGTAALFILSYCFGNMFNLLLIRYAESAVYSVVVLALVTPISTIFWTLFSPTPYLHWQPRFDSNTIYLLVGLVIMMPSVVMYSWFSNQVTEQEVRTEAESKSKRCQERATKQKVAFNDDVVVHEAPESHRVRRIYSEPCLHTGINE